MMLTAAVNVQVLVDHSGYRVQKFYGCNVLEERTEGRLARLFQSVRLQEHLRFGYFCCQPFRNEGVSVRQCG